MKRKVAKIVLGTMLLSMVFSNQGEAKASPKLSTKNVSIKTGQTKTITLKNAKKKVTWKSSNKKVVEIISKSGKNKSKCKFWGLKKGTATITAKSAGKSYRCKVKVDETKSTSTSNKPSNPAPTTTPKPAPAVTAEQQAAAFQTLIQFLNTNGYDNGKGAKVISYDDNSGKYSYRFGISYSEAENKISFVTISEGTTSSGTEVQDGISLDVNLATLPSGVVNYAITYASGTAAVLTLNANLSDIASSNKHSWSCVDCTNDLSSASFDTLANLYLDLSYLGWENALAKSGCPLKLVELGFGS